jgi:hypothetical protein
MGVTLSEILLMQDFRPLAPESINRACATEFLNYYLQLVRIIGSFFRLRLIKWICWFNKRDCVGNSRGINFCRAASFFNKDSICLKIHNKILL